MTDVCCGKNLCQNKIRWSIILRYGLHILFTRRYHLPQANFDQEHFVIWKWFVYHHFCDKCSSWTQNNLPFHSITVKTSTPVNLYYCFYYYKHTLSRLQCIFLFYLLNSNPQLLGFNSGELDPSLYLALDFNRLFSNLGERIQSHEHSSWAYILPHQCKSVNLNIRPQHTR